MDSESRWSARFGAAAVFVLLATVCALPWLHGGNIPLARFVLQIGSVVAAVLSLISCLVRNERAGYPPVVYPLAVLAAVGVIQLAPLHAPVVTQMNHAVYADLRAQFSAPNSGELTVRSASPGDTRVVVAQLVALMLLAMTAYDQLRTRKAVVWSLTAFTLNAAVLSLLAFAQLFQEDLFLIRSVWWTGNGHPFGTFVNPNNAAGWLVMGVASCVGLLVLQVEDAVESRHLPGGRFAPQGLFDGFLRYLASLTSAQVIAWLSLAVIISAMLATRSRTGMVSTGAALLFTACIRLRGPRLGAMLVVGAVGVAGVAGLMALLNLDDAAMRELRTLRDPAGELAGRLRHWNDSLQVVRDFPVFGAGLGAYRYVTLPYQTHGTSFWFQHADNQYVEMLVEAGLVGCTAFVMLGLPILIGAIRMTRRSVAGGIGPAAETVAFVLLFATVAQGVAAMADYGAVLPSTSALFVTLVSMLAAVQAEATFDGLLPVNRVMTAGMRVGLIVGALAFSRDLLLAQNCYLLVIQAEKVAEQPLAWDTMEEREHILERASTVLQARADDARTHEAVSRLLRDTTRSRFLKGIPGFDDPENFENAWPYTTSISIARRVDSLTGEPLRQQHLRSVLRVRIQQSGIIEHCEQVLSQIPVPAAIVRRAARWSLAAGIEDPGHQLVLRARFNEPANAQLSLQLGELAMRSGDTQTAVKIWNQALRLDKWLRGDILAVYLAMDQLEAGLDEFGPQDHSQAVIALSRASTPVLRSTMLSLSDELWTESEVTPSLEVQSHRNDHLRYKGAVQAQIDWLQRCVEWSPEEIGFRRDLAELLFQAGEWRASMDAWYEVLEVDRFNSLAEREIARVRAKLSAERRKAAEDE